MIELVERLAGRQVVLIGDLMLDQVLVRGCGAVEPGRAGAGAALSEGGGRLGGAGRVAADLATLGASVRVVSLLGADETGGQVRRMLGEWRVMCRGSWRRRGGLRRARCGWWGWRSIGIRSR